MDLDKIIAASAMIMATKQKWWLFWHWNRPRQSKHWVSGMLHWVSGMLHWVSGMLHWVSGMLHWVSGMLHWVSGMLHWVSGMLHWVSGMLHWVSGLLLSDFLRLDAWWFFKAYHKLAVNLPETIKNGFWNQLYVVLRLLTLCKVLWHTIKE